MSTRTIEMTMRVAVRRTTAEEIGDAATAEMLAGDGGVIEDAEMEGFATHFAEAVSAVDQGEIMAGSDVFLVAERSSLVAWRPAPAAADQDPTYGDLIHAKLQELNPGDAIAYVETMREIAALATQAVRDEIRPATPVLMGPTNPTGWKLEDLLWQIREEVGAKSNKLLCDARPTARAVLRNNQQVMGLLQQAEALQRDSYDRLDAMAPNEGPLGKPRIGEGSDTAAAQAGAA
jgi:hypothetical protein